MQYIRFPNPIVPSGGIATSDAADGPASPGTSSTTSILIGGQYNTVLPVLASGQQAAIQVDSSGRLLVGSIGSSVTVVQPTGTNLHVVIDSGTITVTNPSVSTTGTPIPGSATFAGFRSSTGNLVGANLTVAGALIVDNTGSTQPISGTVTANIGTTGGLALDATVVALSAKFGTLGQKTMAGSAPVVIASDQTAVPISGTVTANIGTTNGLALDATVSALSAKFGSLGQKTMAGSAPVVIASDQTAVPVSGTVTANIGTTNGLALDATVSALSAKFGSLGQKTMAGSAPVVIASDQSNLPVNITQVGGASLALGQTTASASVPVVIASNQSTINVAMGGSSVVNHIRNDYSSVNVTTAAYVQLIASTASTINRLSIFDSSGQTLVLAFGAAASEVDQIYIFPGGNGIEQLLIPTSTRVSIKAVSANATVGELDINFYG